MRKGEALISSSLFFRCALSWLTGSHSFASKYRRTWLFCFHLLCASIRSIVPRMMRVLRRARLASDGWRFFSNSTRTRARPRAHEMSSGYFAISLGTYEINQLILTDRIPHGAILGRGTVLENGQHQRTLLDVYSEPAVGKSFFTQPKPRTKNNRCLFTKIIVLMILEFRRRSGTCRQRAAWWKSR